MATVLILGGGKGGVVAANVLGKMLGREHRIILFDKKDEHVFYGAYPFLMVNMRKPEQIRKKLSNLRRKGIEFIHTEVKSISTEQSVVRTEEGPFKYDYLILSPGAEFHPESLPGFAEGAFNTYDFMQLNDLCARLVEFQEGTIVYFISSLPFICPTGSYEMIFLLDDYFRNRKKRERVNLKFVTPEPSPLFPAGANIGNKMRKMMEERQIELITEAKVLSLDREAGKLHLDQGVSLEGDLFIGVPPHRGPGVVRDTKLVEDGGWIDVDPHTLKTRAENVFAVGDATNIRLPVRNILAVKSGIMAQYQAEVVARNIASLIAGKEPRQRFKGKGA